MYHQYFGLNEAPFSIAPNPVYLFMSRRHKEALAHLLYGVNHGGGFVLLTGEVGTGKTTVSRALLKQLPQNTDLAYILNPTLSSIELLATICDELKVTDIKDANSLKELSDRLHQFLLDNHAQGRNTVLIIDEAQHLDYKVMEQIRLLTNLETDEKKLLQIVFIGQPELNELLAKPELRQLAQRITARFHIEPLTLVEAQAYIRHRLMVAGMPASQTLFNQSAVKMIHRASDGIPRLINVICDRALLGAYTHNRPMVDTEIARAAISESSHQPSGSGDNQLPIKIATGLTLLLILLLGGLLLTQIGGSDTDPQSAEIALTEPGQILRGSTSAGDTAASAVAEPPAAPATTEEEIYRTSFGQKKDAINALQQALSVFTGNFDQPCRQLKSFGVLCQTEEFRSWQDFTHYNRPGVLRLDIDEQQRYLAVTGTRGPNQLEVVTPDGTQHTWQMFQLGQYWSGQTELLWQPPSSYAPLLKPGDRSPFVRWLANSFAKMDKQTQPLAQFEYNQALERRVMFFQSNTGIPANGVIDLNTVLKMNDKLGVDFKLSSTSSGQ
ncbi:ExeA family protein [Halioxenophilus aromaticivorans]|uniref:ExeA family protein n=1 Tax=Halioxenophilus aromaticivorans TaxID=1306992 RepID=A0AAV3U0X3_9ALTE